MSASVEFRGSRLRASALRDKERAKIECGKAHFKALAVREPSAHYIVARTVDEVLSNEGAA